LGKYLPYITRPILVLSFVSLFTDMASEMLYPIMPAFLKSIGFSILLIGFLEGFAEMVAGLSKGYFGQLSDVRQKRLPFVQLGYLLSAISKPMMAAFTAPLWIFFSRTIDRTGKGLRSAPRDALLSAAATKENKAKVFGFHRSMDTFGAVIGPLLALLFLYFYPGEYNTLFLIAFIPGIIAVLLTLTVKEKVGKPKLEKINFFSFLGYLKHAEQDYKKLLKGLLLFALVNSSDVLLLFKMKEAGVDDLLIIMIYIFYNLVYALAAFPAGIIADKIGMKPTFIFGLVLFALVYVGFTFVEDTNWFWLLFLVYGLYAATTEGVAKAWITNIVSTGTAGTAIGAYTGLASIAAFLASATAGVLWTVFGSEFAFGFTALTAAGVAIYLGSIRFGVKSTS